MNSLQQICMKLPPEAHVLIWLGYLLWEYGLGKTRFGSSFGLVIEKPIVATLKYLKFIPDGLPPNH